MKKICTMLLCAAFSISALSSAAVPGLGQAKEWTVKNIDKARRLWFCYRNPNQCSKEEISSAKHWVYGLGGTVTAAAILGASAYLATPERIYNYLNVNKLVDETVSAINQSFSNVGSTFGWNTNNSSFSIHFPQPSSPQTLTVEVKLNTKLRIFFTIEEFKTRLIEKLKGGTEKLDIEKITFRLIFDTPQIKKQEDFVYEVPASQRPIANPLYKAASITPGN